MSDLNPKGVTLELGGQEYKLLFTLNAIDEIQEATNKPLFEAVQAAAGAADGKMDHETILHLRTILTILINDSGGNLTEKEVGRMLTLANFQQAAWKVLQAFGLDIPEPSEDDEEDEEEEDADSPKEAGP